MFITKPDYRCPISSLLGGASDSYWKVAEMALAVPWFMVNLRQFETPREIADGQAVFDITRTLLVSDVNDLLTMLEEPMERTVVEAVMLVTPPHMNESPDWQMSRISAIWELAEMIDGEECGLKVPVVEASDGRLIPSFPTEARIERTQLVLRIRLHAESQ